MAPNTFAMTDTQLTWMKKYCSGYSPNSQVEINMTYNMGPFYVTALTCPHPMFVYRNQPTKHHTTLAAMMTSITKEREDYEYLAGSLFSKQAIEQAFENIYPNGQGPDRRRNIHLPCFMYTKADIKVRLQRLKVGSMKQKKLFQMFGGEQDGKIIKGHFPTGSQTPKDI